jgi:hypothetical protein
VKRAKDWWPDIDNRATLQKAADDVEEVLMSREIDHEV